tara:strand:+ start:477 stop:767 length:291 start_codon:yes stop_codon:yes gene_type:complete
MSNTIDKVQNIQNQVHRLIDIYRNAEKSLGEKNNKIQELSQHLEMERQKNSDLASQIEELRLILAFDGNQKDRSAMKEQLNDWIKDINKCLAQLNI